VNNFVNSRELLQSLAVIRAPRLIRLSACLSAMANTSRQILPTGGEAGSSLHTQPAHDELIIVLDGEAEFRVGAETRHIGPGDMVFIPRNTLHGRVERSLRRGPHYQSMLRSLIGRKRT
jgi:mannose-6-phosphate isomerase-like protein (cupin superfamily)